MRYFSQDVSEVNPPQDPEAELKRLLQPETRPISHEQLVVEVKGIYAGLVMVEAKCIDIDERQSAAVQENDPAKRTDLKNDQWQSLIALRKQLLHEHHDFFLASQHPLASSTLSRLASKYSMPARMWRHGIHAFLEVLRHRLPESLEHMLAFIYIAYSMMALLYETFPTFEDTWIECLGDLGRYRMAIEDDEPKDREVWSNVARFWYNKASNKSPHMGRLYHHLAILARPYTLEQLSLYTRSLTCVTPFESAKCSIITLFNPIFHAKDPSLARHRSLSLEKWAHEILFNRQHSKSTADPDATSSHSQMKDFLDVYVRKFNTRFMVNGVFAAIPNIAALSDYGRARDNNENLLISYETGQKRTSERQETLLSAIGMPCSSASSDNLGSAEPGRPLPEDFVLRGQLYTQWYFPRNWFVANTTDDEAHSLESSAISLPRIERVLWLGRRVASVWFSAFNSQDPEISWSLQHYVTAKRGGSPMTSIARGKIQKSILFAPCLALLLPTASGKPVRFASDDPLYVAPLVPPAAPFTGLPYLVFAAAVLPLAHVLAKRRGSVPVWGSMMAVLAFGWWGIRDDATTTLWLSGTVFAMWMISTFLYGYANFQRFGISETVSLIILVEAAVLDLAVVGSMTPTGVPVSQSDLLNFSLPSMSLSLAISVNIVAFVRKTPAHYQHSDAELPMNRALNHFGAFNHPHSISGPIEANHVFSELPAP